MNFDYLLQFFEYAHLQNTDAAFVSKAFHDLAHGLCGNPHGKVIATITAPVPSNPERTMALRKLLEAKDCAVRAVIMK